MRQTRGRIFAATDVSGLAVGGARGREGKDEEVPIWETYFRLG